MKASFSTHLTQLALTWLIGSLSLGTVALLFVAGEPPDLFRPLPAFSPLGLLALVGLFGVLFAGLLVTVWLTPEASWLTERARGRVLWAVVVGGAGFAGWGFAATVTFLAGWSHGVQIMLGYLGGGLPFVLVAAMLQRTWRVAAAAAGVALVAVVAGVLIAEVGPYGVLGHYFQLLSTMFTPIFPAV